MDAVPTAFTSFGSMRSSAFAHLLRLRVVYPILRVDDVKLDIRLLVGEVVLSGQPPAILDRCVCPLIVDLTRGCSHYARVADPLQVPAVRRDVHEIAALCLGPMGAPRSRPSMLDPVGDDLLLVNLELLLCRCPVWAPPPPKVGISSATKIVS